MTSVCAVIVTYNPEENLASNIALLRPQVDAVVVIDNASRPDRQHILHELALQYNCLIIRNPGNYGIACALNQGIRAARNLCVSWVAFFDQDSTVEHHFIANLMRVFTESPTPEEIAVAAPRYVDRLSGETIVMPSWSRGGLLYAFTSGSLLRVSTFEQIGYHDENLFIDYVDIEWCLRARQRGLRIIELQDAKLLHSLANLTFRNFLSHRVPVLNSSVGRCYYRARNRTHIYLRGKYDWEWLRQDLYGHIIELVAICLWETDRRKKFESIARGYIDAVRGRLGKTVNL